MADDNPISAIGSATSAPPSSGAGGASQLSAPSGGASEARTAGDSSPINTRDHVNLSDEAAEEASHGSDKGHDAETDKLKKEIEELKKQLAEKNKAQNADPGQPAGAPQQAAPAQGAAPAGQQVQGPQNWDSTLVQDVAAVQQERNGGGIGLGSALGGGTGFQTPGTTPGMSGGGVMTPQGFGGANPGMHSGGVFTSGGGPLMGAQSGGGQASPATVKLQTDYAQAIQSGAQLRPETQQLVQSVLAGPGGGGSQPLQAMLGAGQQQRA